MSNSTFFFNMITSLTIYICTMKRLKITILSLMSHGQLFKERGPQVDAHCTKSFKLQVSLLQQQASIMITDWVLSNNAAK